MNLNWNLIFKLSLFGLAMALGTVYFIPSNIEPIFWLIIFIICAYLIAKNCSSKYFLHGLLVSLVNCIWITAAHILLFNTYISNHAKEAEMMKTMPMPDSPKLMMLVTGPIVGVVSGLVLGLFAFIASKIVKKQSV
ncbi:hypothetical protein [Pinibacter soli]|uniref:DUF4199 domain-containing protein n=1 Tax=Pinibacter soli TaxID=3044211 RepID=A0ABT6RDU2_9BACT|nr:hypothetical protein [Pinibacter soli]MDI3320749.1 hypothetical protein [Pinibacter soli]